jgi:hypothetical protein
VKRHDLVTYVTPNADETPGELYRVLRVFRNWEDRLRIEATPLRCQHMTFKPWQLYDADDFKVVVEHDLDAAMHTLAQDALTRSRMIHCVRVRNATINPALGAGAQSGMGDVIYLANTIIKERTLAAREEAA